MVTVGELAHLEPFTANLSADSRPTEGSPTGLRIEDLELSDSVRELSPLWSAFRRRAAVGSPFLRPDYLALWARMMGVADRCHVVAAWRGEELVGVGPFMITEDAFGPFALRVLRFVGNNVGFPGDVMYSDIAAVPPRAPILRAILKRASRWRASAWDFGYVRPASETRTLAPEILGARGNGGGGERLPYVTRPLPDDWDAFLKGLSGEVRRNFRRRVRRLSEIGSVEVRMARTPADVRRAILGLLRNQERWLRGTPREHWLGGAGVEPFLVAAGELLAAEGAYFGFTLELEGEPIAWNIGAFDRGRYFEQMASFDRTYRACAPGALLGILVAKRLIEQRAERIELGPGFDERKRRLGGVPEDFEHLRGYRGWVRTLAVLRHALRGESS